MAYREPARPPAQAIAFLEMSAGRDESNSSAARVCPLLPTDGLTAGGAAEDAHERQHGGGPRQEAGGKGPAAVGPLLLAPALGGGRRGWLVVRRPALGPAPGPTARAARTARPATTGHGYAWPAVKHLRHACGQGLKKGGGGKGAGWGAAGGRQAPSRLWWRSLCTQSATQPAYSKPAILLLKLKIDWILQSA